MNTLYNARIRDIDLVIVASHIAALGIDPILQQGLLSAVDLIADCGQLRRYFSFATKFSSWHDSVAYPIYDGNVAESLWAFKLRDHFSTFHRQDLLSYGQFVGVVTAFRSFYELDSLTFKGLDKFLWRVGHNILTSQTIN